MAKFLLHSMSEFSEIFDNILEEKKPNTIVEIGSEYGGSTKIIIEYCRKHNAFISVIDPNPYTNLSEKFNGLENYYKHYKDTSINALPLIAPADIYFIDGDHNYWTVKNELDLIFQLNKNAWVILHDVAFPWGRRDLYYKPSDIPAEFLHEYTYEKGVDENNNIADHGFSGNGNFAFSLRKGGERNGVLTAIEDFISDKEDHYHFSMIEPIFGLGVLVPKGEKELIEAIFFPYKNKLISRMERNRIELYMELLRVQAENDALKSRFLVKATNLIGKVISINGKLF